MTKNDYRETLIELVRAVGQELIDRAPDIVGEYTDGLANFSINISFPAPVLDELPIINISKSHMSKNSLHVVLDAHR